MASEDIFITKIDDSDVEHDKNDIELMSVSEENDNECNVEDDRKYLFETQAKKGQIKDFSLVQDNVEEFFNNLLLTGIFADLTLQVGEKKVHLHKPIVLHRCPQLISVSLPKSENSAKALFKYLYTNTFDDLNHEENIELLSVVKELKLKDLEEKVQSNLLKVVSNQNVYEILKLCYHHSLKTEEEWMLWYIATNRVVTDDVTTLDKELLKTVMDQMATLTLPSPPNLSPSPTPLKTILKELYESKDHCDLTIHVNETAIKCHKCILGPQWPYVKQNAKKIYENKLSANAFQKLVNYFYTGDTNNLDLETCGWIIAQSKAMDISNKQLLDICTQRLEKIEPEDWSVALELSIILGNEQLKKNALNAMPKEIENILNLLIINMEKQNKESQELKSTILSQSERIQVLETALNIQSPVHNAHNSNKRKNLQTQHLPTRKRMKFSKKELLKLNN